MRIAVDNFGSSLAPLNLLARLPIDVVKLDPRLTVGCNFHGPPAGGARVGDPHSQTLGMQVVAQGIETAAQLEAMCRMGCELGQGHLLSYAVDANRASHLAGIGYWTEVPEA